MEFRILGQLEASAGGAPLDLGPHKQRSLLALLLINANRTVTTDRILEELWGDEAEGKENAVWVYISRIRSALGEEPSPLQTKDGGYTLLVDPGSVDFLRFESEAVAGRNVMRDDPEAAAARLREALSLWRGDALEDFRYDEFAQSEIHRLEELRTAATEDRIEADLRLGASGELIAELDALIESDPLAERPISFKMMALYRAGRQAEALRTFERFRRHLGEEMGIEPSPELSRLEEQILLHDSRLQTTMRSRTAVMPTEYATNPFKGLQPFQEGDADRFFGRDRLVAEVIRRIADQRLVTLVGPSGSGKSSAVRAGVIPAVRKEAIPDSDRWLVAQMVPGSRPFAELEAALLRSTIDAPDSLTDQLTGDEAGILRAVLRVLPDDRATLLLVIDQFEELFTLVDDEDTRRRFLDGLLEAVDEPHGRVRVLLTLRADFYDRPLHYPLFGTRLGDGVVNVVPMTPDELEQAAEAPAARAGVRLEPPLVAALLTDVVGQPGALPLFQYTLTELFDRRSDVMLDLAAYEEMGGLRGTLSRRADELFDGLSDTERAAARQLFLRLVAIADSEEWSRRRVRAAEIIALDTDVVDLKAVIDAFGSARLLTFDRDHVTGSPTVEVAHEALLTEWERLRTWIDEARDDVRRQARLALAASEWRSSEQNPDYLLTGSRLDEFEAWAALTTLSLTAGERAYLDASVAKRGAIVAAEEERAAREHALDRRARRRLWGLAAAAVILVTAAVTALVLALAPGPPTIVLIGEPGSGNPLAQQIANGFNQAARDLDFEAVHLEPTSSASGELADLLDSGPDLVIIGTLNFSSIYGQAPEEVATRYPDTLFVVIDGFQRAPNIVSVTSKSEEGSFLAGAAAALTSRTGTVGMVNAPVLVEFRAGFEAGAAHVRDDVTVRTRHLLGPPFRVYNDPDQAYTAAMALHGRGADVIYTAAGNSGEGALAATVQASAEQGRLGQLWAIGADVDVSLFTDPEQRDHLLTSVLIRRDNAVRTVVERYLDGTLEPGDLVLGVADEVIDYSTESSHLEATVIARLEEIKAQIASGEIVVPVVPAGPPSDDPEPDVVFTAVVGDDVCTLSVPSAITWGDIVRVEVTNTGSREYGSWLTLWNDGVSEEQIEAAGLGQFSLTPYFSMAAGTEMAAGGSSAYTAKMTDPGTWGVNCFDGVTVRSAGLFDVVVPADGDPTGIGTAYLDAWNMGDVDAAMALLAPDAVLTDEFSGTVSAQEWEAILAWDAAEGTLITDPDCGVLERTDDGEVTLACRHGTHIAIAQAVGAPPVETVTMLRIRDGNAVEVEVTYGNPDFLPVYVPFLAWMEDNYPEDVERVDFGTWRSREEAAATGLLFKQYASTWADYLAARGCTYLDTDC